MKREPSAGTCGSIQPSLLTVLAAVTLAAVLLSSPAAAQSCGDLPPSTLRMFGTEHDGLTVAAADMAEIDRLAAVHNIPAPMRDVPLVLIVPQLTSSFAVEERAIESSPGVFCAAPEAVELRMGVTDYKVYIERAAYTDACVREQLLDRARLHLDADNQGLVQVMNEMREPLGDALTRLKATPAASGDAAIAHLKDGVAALLLRAVERFGRLRAQLHAAIDTPDELARLGATCDGRTRMLESQARLPGRET